VTAKTSKSKETITENKIKTCIMWADFQYLKEYKREKNNEK
jgi:hypothetical protein